MSMSRHDLAAIKKRIQSAGPVTDEVTVWIGVRMPVVEEYRRAKERLAQLNGGGDSLGSIEGSLERNTLSQRVNELRAQLDECALTLTVRALSDDEWQRLMEEHPPRRAADGAEQGDPRDARAGWNTTTFPKALVRSATIDPPLDDEDWSTLLGDADRPGLLPHPEIDRAGGVVARLSRVTLDVPFS